VSAARDLAEVLTPLSSRGERGTAVVALADADTVASAVPGRIETTTVCPSAATEPGSNCAARYSDTDERSATAVSDASAATATYRLRAGETEVPRSSHEKAVKRAELAFSPGETKAIADSVRLLGSFLRAAVPPGPSTVRAVSLAGEAQQLATSMICDFPQFPSTSGFDTTVGGATTGDDPLPTITGGDALPTITGGDAIDSDGTKGPSTVGIRFVRTGAMSRTSGVGGGCGPIGVGVEGRSVPRMIRKGTPPPGN